MVKRLFSNTFLLKYSEVDTVDALIELGGFKVTSQDEFFAIPDDEWDAVINVHTEFASWQEMLIAAANELGERHDPQGD